MNIHILVALKAPSRDNEPLSLKKCYATPGTRGQLPILVRGNTLK